MEELVPEAILDGVLRFAAEFRGRLVTETMLVAGLNDGEAEAHLIALACSSPPEGHERWSLRLLRDRFIEAGYAEQVSHETIRRVLKKTN